MKKKVKFKTTSAEIGDWLKKNRHLLTYPEATLGDEPGTFHRPWKSADLRVCFVAWNSYMRLAGSLTLPMLTRMIGEQFPNIVCERSYFPADIREFGIYQKNGIPPYSLETKHPLVDFDVLGMSLSLTGGNVNLLQTMRKSGIPLYSKDRDKSYPIIIHGGVGGYNPAPVAAFFDIFYVGEAEANFVEIIQTIIDLKDKLSREELLFKLAQIRGVYVPCFYTESWSKGRFNGWHVKHGVSKIVDRAYLSDPNKGFLYKHPLVHYGEGMGHGEVLFALSCPNMCNFCIESWITKPYREYDREVIVNTLKNVMRESGSNRILPSAFSMSCHSQRNGVVLDLYTQVCDNVKLLSNRVDDCAIDPGFVALSRKMGNKTIAFGLEGISQRLRQLVNKNITEDQILAAYKNALEAGYCRIKFYILQGLPGECESDWQEFMNLAKRMAKLRDEIAPDAWVRFGWTLLRIHAHTPFQWYEPPQWNYSYEYGKILKEELKFDVPFNTAKEVDSAFFLQLLALGDGRLAPILAECVGEMDCCFFSGITVGTKDFVLQRMEKYGLTIDDYFRARDITEILPWDNINYGVSKEYLIERYENSKIGLELSRCDRGCSQCGVCSEEDQQIRKRQLANVDVPVSVEDVEKIKPVRQRGTVQRYLFRVVQDEIHRFLGKAARKNMFRRVLYLRDLPVTKTVSFAGEQEGVENWTYGCDYAEVSFHTHVFDMENHVQAMNNDLSGFEILGFRRFDPGVRSVYGNCDTCLQELEVRDSPDKLRGLVKEFLDRSPVADNLQELKGSVRTAFIKEHITITRIRVPGLRQVAVEIVDCRPHVIKMGVRTDSDSRTYLQAYIRGKKVNLYHIYQAMSNEGFRGVRGLPCKRLDFYLPRRDSLVEARCRQCKEPAFVNLFEESALTDGLCLSCSNWET